jgi:hypothetical protein
MTFTLLQVLWLGAGVAAAVGTALAFRLVGFDRDRSTWPLVLIAIALSYVALAAGAGATLSMGLEVVLALPFIAAAVAAFHHHHRLILAGALIAHGALDLAHHDLLDHPGVPAPYPWLCLGYDLTLAAWIALRR